MRWLQEALLRPGRPHSGAGQTGSNRFGAKIEDDEEDEEEKDWGGEGVGGKNTKLRNKAILKMQVSPDFMWVKWWF